MLSIIRVRIASLKRRERWDLFAMIINCKTSWRSRIMRRLHILHLVGGLMLKKKGFLQRSLDRIEFIGNKLPHPVTLFALLALLVLVLSAVFSQFGISVEHPGEEGKTVE